jgi:hypothetical protein
MQINVIYQSSSEPQSTHSPYILESNEAALLPQKGDLVINGDKAVQVLSRTFSYVQGRMIVTLQLP